MFHQLIEARRQSVYAMWKLGLSRKFIAEAWGITERRVRCIIKVMEAREQE